MKKLINRLICHLKGHKWELVGVGDLKISHNRIVDVYTYKCTRCGEIQERTPI